MIDDQLARVKLFRKILSSEHLFKINFGSMNPKCLRLLGYIYSLAGCQAFGTSANPEMVSILKANLRKAYETSNELNLNVKTYPYIISRINSSMIYS